MIIKFTLSQLLLNSSADLLAYEIIFLKVGGIAAVKHAFCT